MVRLQMVAAAATVSAAVIAGLVAMLLGSASRAAATQPPATEAVLMRPGVYFGTTPQGEAPVLVR